MSRVVVNQSKGGIGLCDALLLLFITLKLVGVITWSWVWVLTPLWSTFVVMSIVNYIKKS